MSELQTAVPNKKSMIFALLSTFAIIFIGGALVSSILSPTEHTAIMPYNDWLAVGVWIVLFGLFIAFIPFYKKSQRKSTSVYIAFIVALALEMFGIPLSLYIATWALGIILPPGILWQHTLQQYIGYSGMIIGYALNLAGALLVIQGWSRVHKEYWGKTEGQGKLVTGGVYAYIRHPQYAGFMLITLGLLVHWATIPLLVMWPILTLLYYRLARREERDMLKEFGDVYDAYRKRTSMFFPFHLFGVSRVKKG